MQSLIWNHHVFGSSPERVYGIPDPFFLPGRGVHAETVLYMVHGFTGTPSEFRRLGYYLNDQGYTVKAILLPGHGTAPEDMLRTGHLDWWMGVKRGFEELRREGFSRIIPVGHSMGGLLSLKLAMEEEVPGVVSLATPIHLGSSRKVILAAVLKFFIKYVAKRRPPGMEEIVKESRAYDKLPVACVHSFRRLLVQVKEQLHRVQVPLFIAQGELDRTSLPRSAPFIYSKVGSLLKEMKVYPNSAHAILLDQDRERVYEDIGRFVAGLSL